MTSSSSRSRSSALFCVAAAATALAAVAVRAQTPPSLVDQAVAAVYPDPSPSERGAGNTLYTTLSNNQTDSSISALIKSNPTASAVKAAISDASHAVTNTITALEDPKGNFTLAKWHAIDDAEFRVWNASSKTCNNNTLLPKPPLSFAFQGAGLLVFYYFGVVQGLQQKGVLSPQVQSTASFGGLSGGSLTAVLTAAGWKGSEMYSLFLQVIASITQCKANYPNDPLEAALQCSINAIGVPIVKAQMLQKATEAEILARVNGRVTIWACQVNPLSTSLANSVGQGTSQFSSFADIFDVIMGSDMIPCFSDDRFYNTFRGSAYIDGGYCVDYAQLCPGGLTGKTTKCLKISTAFIGPDIPAGTQPATSNNCPFVVPDNKWPNTGKGYFTPSNESTWTLANGNCRSAADKQRAGVNTLPFVPHGVTALPDIHPAFYAPLPSVFPTACAWQESSSAPQYGVPGFAAMYQHGIDSAVGWANANSYC